MTDSISRQAAIDVLKVFTQKDALGFTPKQIVDALPSAQQDIVEKILAAGKEGKEVRICIGGRLFAVRELAQ